MFNPAFHLKKTRNSKNFIVLLFFAIIVGFGVSLFPFASSGFSQDVVPLQSGFFFFAAFFLLIVVVTLYLWWRKKTKEKLAFRKTF
ncbi:MAG TPA: hypothetical protein HA294_01380 [Nanoarchaeota archaeon]|nr:hypothetical protein [Candidatus Woesearchaeota archaeon]HIH15721.1 hypothetical protein [Nanoarchaeota archaeon]HIH58634.1 hypothetical protein [Nanoarchaeota archaeon]